MGILININEHVCCLFICDGEKFYNDNDEKIYNCKWKDLLQQETIGKQLYIIEGCLEFIDINTYEGDIKKISKVLYLTVISKHRKDTTLDIDIKRLLEFKELDEIKDMEIQGFVAYHYYGSRQFDKARKLYGLAANQGNILAQYNLGEMLYNGKGGDKDLKEARQLFTLAANQGDIEAQFRLGEMLSNGEGGKTDYKMAREYFKLAANQGYSDAQYMLGLLLHFGEGGDKDAVEARHMLTLAATQGNKKAQDALDQLDVMLSGKAEQDRLRIEAEQDRLRIEAEQDRLRIEAEAKKAEP